MCIQILRNYKGMMACRTSMLSVLILGLSVSVTVNAAEVNLIHQAGKMDVSQSQLSLNFVQVLERVQQYQAQQGVWQLQQSIADSAIRQSALWQNPSLSVQQTGFKAGEDQELEFGISQKLDIFGERKAAKRLAEVQRQKVDLNQNLYDAQLKLVVKYPWSQVAILELENQIAQAQLTNSQAILDATRLRYRAGSIAQVDQDRTLVTHIENQRAAKEIELNLEIAKKRLANLWGASHDDFSIGLNSKSTWPVQSKTDVAQYLKDNLLERSIQLQMQQKRSSIDYLKAKRRPNPTINVGVVNNKSADTRQSERQLRVALEIPLNIFDRQQYPLQVAQAQQEFLSRQQRFYTQQNLNAIATLQSELAGLKQQYELMNDQQIPLSEQVQGKMLLGFKVGKYAITDVQLATEQLQQQRLKKLQLLKTAWQKAIETESLALGIQPEQVTSSDALHQINQSLWQETSNLNSLSGAE